MSYTQLGRVPPPPRQVPVTLAMERVVSAALTERPWIPQEEIYRTFCKKLSQTCTKLSSSSRPMGTEILPTILLPT